MTTPSAAELGRQLANVLEAANVPHALGGALALGVWGFPRATVDVDLDIFATPEELGPALDALARAGFAIDREAATAEAAGRGQFTFRHGGMRVDVFVVSHPFYDSVRTRIRRAPLEGRPAWFLSPEDLVVFKFLFFRGKDIVDVERLVAQRQDDLDHAYIRGWLVDLVGEDDERVVRWDRLAMDATGP